MNASLDAFVLILFPAPCDGKHSKMVRVTAVFQFFVEQLYDCKKLSGPWYSGLTRNAMAKSPNVAVNLSYYGNPFCWIGFLGK